MTRSRPRVRALQGDAGEKQHDLAAFTQHGDGGDDAEGRDRLGPRRHGVADFAQVRNKLACVVGHPDDVPREHDDGQRQHGEREQLLASPVEGR